MIHCIVIDDEPLAIQQMEHYINKTPSLELAGSFNSAIKAQEFLAKNTVDLFFVDINMPSISGLEFAKTVKAPSRIIFTTAYREHALEGFQLDAADYLLKPISYDAFLKSIEKVQSRYFSTTHNHQSENDFIFVRSNYQTIKIEFSTILYIESKREYLDIVLSTGETITTHSSLNLFTEKLPKDRFLRVHRSFTVNLTQIHTIERQCILFGKQHIPINDAAKARVMQYVGS